MMVAFKMAALRNSLTLCRIFLINIIFTSCFALHFQPTPAGRECTAQEFACESGSDCIPRSWMCDGDEDCQDGSDEQHSVCDNVTCSPNQFQCAQTNHTQCLPMDYRCDHQRDCLDGSDEKDCDVTCDSNQFSCLADNHCIPLRWVCDGESECSDDSDESNCSARTCAPNNFMCLTDSRCIPDSWKCDGDLDCLDGSDEHNCTSGLPSTNTCTSERYFYCHDGSQCIHNAWKCDGDEDCLDGSDEDECRECGDDMFNCGAPGHQCIPQSLRCNGIYDCENHHDERNCNFMSRPQSCRDDQFDCSNTGLECIPRNKVCDGFSDCRDNNDELLSLCSETNPCSTMNCSHSCQFRHRNNSFCECPSGYYLNDDGRTCNDIDECKLFETCSQVCINTPGSYECKCFEGYIWHAYPGICKAAGPEPQLVFANRLNVNRFNLHSGGLQPLIEGTKSAVALDYDHNGQRIFWSDVAMEHINMASYNGSVTGPPELVAEDDVSTPDGLAFDWIHSNLYWTDTGIDAISVVHIDADPALRHRRRLIQIGLDEPRAIVVDPRENQRWIYWSDWGHRPSISRAGLNGRNAGPIFNNSLYTIWPNGLTIDYLSERLYWVDAKLLTICSTNLVGRDFHMVYRSDRTLNMPHMVHPFAITVFEDYLYWSDWENESIFKVHKKNGKNVTTLAQRLHSPMDLHVYHPYKQPAAINVCGADNGGCSHLCLPNAVIILANGMVDTNSAKYECFCPDGMELKGKTCTGGSTPSGPDYNVIPGKDKTDKPNVKPLTRKTSAQDKMPVGAVAAIVAGILLLLIIVAIVIGFVYRRYSRHSVRSMNFDNPVYRKTTEDQFCIEKNQYQPSKVPSTMEPLNTTTEQV